MRRRQRPGLRAHRLCDEGPVLQLLQLPDVCGHVGLEHVRVDHRRAVCAACGHHGRGSHLPHVGHAAAVPAPRGTAPPHAPQPAPARVASLQLALPLEAVCAQPAQLRGAFLRHVAREPAFALRHVCASHHEQVRRHAERGHGRPAPVHPEGPAQDRRHRPGARDVLPNRGVPLRRPRLVQQHRPAQARRQGQALRGRRRRVRQHRRELTRGHRAGRTLLRLHV